MQLTVEGDLTQSTLWGSIWYWHGTGH